MCETWYESFVDICAVRLLTYFLISTLQWSKVGKDRDTNLSVDYLIRKLSTPKIVVSSWLTLDMIEWFSSFHICSSRKLGLRQNWMLFSPYLVKYYRKEEGGTKRTFLTLNISWFFRPLLQREPWMYNVFTEEIIYWREK